MEKDGENYGLKLKKKKKNCFITEESRGEQLENGHKFFSFLPMHY